jgi:hypothetical protein
MKIIIAPFDDEVRVTFKSFTFFSKGNGDDFFHLREERIQR